MDFAALGERLIERLAEDLDDLRVNEQLEELKESFESGSWGRVALHLDGGTDDVFEEMAEAGVDVRPVLAYLVGLTALMFDGYGTRIDWQTLHVCLGGYAEQCLRHYWTVALESSSPLGDDLPGLLEAWREQADEVIPDEVSRLEKGILEGFNELDEQLVHMGEIESIPEDSEDYDDAAAAADERVARALRSVKRILDR